MHTVPLCGTGWCTVPVDDSLHSNLWRTLPVFFQERVKTAALRLHRVPKTTKKAQDKKEIAA